MRTSITVVGIVLLTMSSAHGANTGASCNIVLANNTSQQVSVGNITDFADRVLELAHSPNVGSLELAVNQAMNETFSNIAYSTANLAALLRDPVGTKDSLSEANSVFLTSQAEILKRMKSLDSALNPKGWDKFLAIFLSEDRKARKISKTAEEIQICRSRTLDCLDEMAVAVKAADARLLELNKFHEALLIGAAKISAAATAVTGASLTEAQKASLLMPLQDKQKEFLLISGMVETAIRQVGSEVSGALQAERTLRSTVDIILQQMILKGAPANVLERADIKALEEKNRLIEKEAEEKKRQAAEVKRQESERKAVRDGNQLIENLTRFGESIAIVDTTSTDAYRKMQKMSDLAAETAEFQFKDVMAVFRLFPASTYTELEKNSLTIGLVSQALKENGLNKWVNSSYYADFSLIVTLLRRASLRGISSDELEGLRYRAQLIIRKTREFNRRNQAYQLDLVILIDTLITQAVLR